MIFFFLVKTMQEAISKELKELMFSRNTFPVFCTAGYIKNEEGWTHNLSDPNVTELPMSSCSERIQCLRTLLNLKNTSSSTRNIFYFLKKGWCSALYLAETSHWLPPFPRFPRWPHVSFRPDAFAPGSPGLLLLVHLHVLPEVWALAEALAALTALVGLLPSVGSLVLNEVGALAEAPATLVTLVRLFSSVNSLVLNEVWALFKPLSTLIAPIGVLPGVDAAMLNEVRTLKEAFPTVRTLVGLLSSMDLLVLEESRALTEALFTFDTLIRLFIQASSQSPEAWVKSDSRPASLPLPAGSALVLLDFSLAWAPRYTSFRFS